MQRGVLKYLRSLPYSFFENRSPGAFTASGVADVVGCLRGQFVAIELKAPSKSATPTPVQLAYLEAVRHAGGFVTCANSLDTVKRFVASVLETLG